MIIFPPILRGPIISDRNVYYANDHFNSSFLSSACIHAAAVETKISAAFADMIGRFPEDGELFQRVRMRVPVCHSCPSPLSFLCTGLSMLGVHFPPCSLCRQGDVCSVLCEQMHRSPHHYKSALHALGPVALSSYVSQCVMHRFGVQGQHLILAPC